MLKKTITYTDFDGVERTEDFFFNLTKAELLEMEMTVDGSFTAHVSKIAAAKDQAELVKFFKELLLKAYGVKSDDGKRFVKNDAVRDEFTATMAYSEIFMELATDAKAATAFVKGIIPADLEPATAPKSIPAPVV